MIPRYPLPSGPTPPHHPTTAPPPAAPPPPHSPRRLTLSPPHLTSHLVTPSPCHLPFPHHIPGSGPASRGGRSRRRGSGDAGCGRETTAVERGCPDKLRLRGRRCHRRPLPLARNKSWPLHASSLLRLVRDRALGKSDQSPKPNGPFERGSSKPQGRMRARKPPLSPVLHLWKGVPKPPPRCRTPNGKDASWAVMIPRGS